MVHGRDPGTFGFRKVPWTLLVLLLITAGHIVTRAHGGWWDSIVSNTKEVARIGAREAAKSGRKVATAAARGAVLHAPRRWLEGDGRSTPLVCRL